MKLCEVGAGLALGVRVDVDESSVSDLVGHFAASAIQESV